MHLDTSVHWTNVLAEAATHASIPVDVRNSVRPLVDCLMAAIAASNIADVASDAESFVDVAPDCLPR